MLFSAAYRPGAGLARLWQFESVELMTSAYAAEEARLNLIEEGQRVRLAKLLEKVHVSNDLAPLPSGVRLPPKDRPILQAVLHARAAFLLTWDTKHFGVYFGRRVGGVLVVRPAEYFELRRQRTG